MQETYKTKTYYKDETTLITLEELNGELFVHVKFTKFSKSILLNALKVWAEIKAKCYYLGYENIYTYTTEDRMMKFFPGAKKVDDIPYRGQKFEVLKWELN